MSSRDLPRANLSLLFVGLVCFVWSYRPGSNALLATFYISSFPNLILAFIPPDLDLKNLNVMIGVSLSPLLFLVAAASRSLFFLLSYVCSSRPVVFSEIRSSTSSLTPS